MSQDTPLRPRSTWWRFNEKLTAGPRAPDCTGDCWSWRAAHFKKTGYAMFSVRGQDGIWRPTVAHRVAYELYRAEIPAGLDLDHLCLNRGCVNPWHLEPVTRAVNLARSRRSGGSAGRKPGSVNVTVRDRCEAGHEYTPENTYRKPSRPNKRICRACNRIRDNARNANGGRREHYQRMYQRRKQRQVAEPLR